MHSTTTRRVALPGGPVHLREIGPGDGPVVVFVHGFLVDGSVWSDVPERLADRGFRCLVPTWPLGAHTEAMNPGTDLSPRGLAHVVLSLLDVCDLRDVTLVGNDTGGAISQLVLSLDHDRIARLVLTNCDAFEAFPPFPFTVLFKLARRPRAARGLLQAMRIPALRRSRLGFGWLVRRRLGAAETEAWVRPFLTNKGVRRDVATFARGWTGEELTDSAGWLREFTKPVLILWATEDPFFRIALGRRLESTFPDARLVEVSDALTFLSLDQPTELAERIADFVAPVEESSSR